MLLPVILTIIIPASYIVEGEIPKNNMEEKHMAEFTNQASLIYNDTITNSNIVVGNLVQALSVSKKAVLPTYSTDDDLTYVVSITNSSGTAYTDLTVTDDLGAYTEGGNNLVPLTYKAGSLKYYINGVLQPDLAPTAGNALTVTGVSIPANGSTILIYEAEPNGFAPLEAESEILNTVRVTGAGIAEDLTAQERVFPVVGVQLSISKAISPSTVSANGQVTYTFVIQNTGNTPADAALGAIVTDTFDPVLKGLTAAYNGEALTLNTDYTYDQTTGLFSTAPGMITVDAATFTRDENTGAVQVTPAVGILTVTGTI